MQTKEEQAPHSSPSNISYNYLVESCVSESKAQVVINMMNETLGFIPEETQPKYSGSDERIIEVILMDNKLSFYTRLTEAHNRCAEVMKKTIIEHYSEIIKDNDMRRELWVIVSRIRTTKQHYPEGYYKNLLASREFPDSNDDIIEKDVKRTRGSPKDHKILINILKAYSRRNSKVGYIQGHNFIARLVLDLIEDEEDSFWIYCFVIEECFSVSYFINLNNLMLDSLMFKILLQAVEPRVAIHLRSIKDFELDLVTFKWFLCLYADSGLPFDYINKIWDLLILGDRLVYMKAGFVILGRLSARLSKAADLPEVYSTVNNLGELVGNDSTDFIKKVSHIYINERILDILRVSNQSKLQRLAALIKVDTDKEEQEEKHRKKIAKRRSAKCTGKTIICAEPKEAPTGPEREYFSFCCKDLLKNKIFNYFSDENSFWERNKKRVGAFHKENDMLVHRSKHTCMEHQLNANFDSYEKKLIETDFSSLDMRKQLLVNFTTLMDGHKLHEEMQKEDLMDDEEDSIESDTKTVKREHGSSRLFRFNTTALN